MTFKKNIKDFLTLSSRERTGILVLFILVILAVVINLFLRYYPFQQKGYDNIRYNQEIELFRSSLRNCEDVREDSLEGTYKEAFHLSPFDPNTATKKELVRLGVEDRIAGRILAYRKKGGRFRRKEDLLKIYGFDRILYATLSPYIIIGKPDISTHNTFQPITKDIHYDNPIEINSSDTAELIRLRGIGPVLASRIVKYRGLLGGYYSVYQLKEVYGISDSLFQTISDNVRVDTSLVTRIFVNDAAEAQLSRHPYIGRYRAKAILYYRESAGHLISTEELVRNKIIPEEYEEKIKAYLSFQTRGDED